MKTKLRNMYISNEVRLLCLRVLLVMPGDVLPFSVPFFSCGGRWNTVVPTTEQSEQLNMQWIPLPATVCGSIISSFSHWNQLECTRINGGGVASGPFVYAFSLPDGFYCHGSCLFVSSSKYILQSMYREVFHRKLY